MKLSSLKLSISSEIQERTRKFSKCLRTMRSMFFAFSTSCSEIKRELISNLMRLRIGLLNLKSLRVD